MVRIHSGISLSARAPEACVLGLGEETGRVLLHQAIRRGLLRAVALVLNQDAVRRPARLPASGLRVTPPRM
jgi:hypothetical protein